MWLQSTMNNHSDLSDTNGEDESRVALHRRCTDSNASTVLFATSGTTIYSVASLRPASVARQYRKQIINQHRLIYRDDTWLFVCF
jgi:hypothetical protein